MLPEKKDRAWLWDMLEAARSVCKFSEGLSCDDFLGDERTQAAVERKVEIIGEAARRISDEFKAAYPQIEWRSIVGLRNILAHQYDEIVEEQIWLLTQRHIPRLIQFLESLDPPLAEEGNSKP